MRLGVILRYVGLTTLVIAFFMLICFGVALYFGDGGRVPLLFGALITALVGLFPLVFVPSVSQISSKEGYAIVVFSWLFVCFFGMIPYVLYGGEFNFSAAWFEAVSGFTTTGATILNDIEALPRSLLLWRSLTHWIGGMGVVVFALVVLPSMGRARMTLSRTELSRIARQDFRYRSRKMLHVMGTTYLSLTLLTTLSLWLVEIPLFDALNLSFSSVATGGFAIKNASVAAYANPSAEWILIISMFLSSLHFGLLFGLFLGRFRSLFRSPVVRFFAIFVVITALLIALNCYGEYFTVWSDSLRHAFFQVVSIISTTGFASVDYSLWPAFSLLILIFLMAVGGCSGSTSGGIKADRIVILLATFRTSTHRLRHPNAVVNVRVGKLSLAPEETHEVLLYICAYFAIVLLSTLILTFGGMDIVLSLSSSFSSMGNVGPGIGSMGSFDSFSFLPTYARILLSLLMLLGRLEIWGLLLVFFPSYWK